MTQQVSFRPICDADRETLLRIYSSSRTAELASFPWSEEQKTAFLQMQFQAQHLHYQDEFAGARFQLILLDGQIAGRLYVHCSEHEMRLVDNTLLPEYRGAGIGSAILRDLLAEALAIGKPLMLQVRFDNPAQRLYQRMGFQLIDEEFPYHQMMWTAPSGAN